MNKKQTTISIIVVLLIFYFWKAKKRAKFGCANLLQNMSNDSAEQNDNDILTALTDQSALEQKSLTKMKCLYATDYMIANGVINLNEKDSIRKCICDNITA